MKQAIAPLPTELEVLSQALDDALNRAQDADAEHSEAAWLEYEAARKRLNAYIIEEKRTQGYEVFTQ